MKIMKRFFAIILLLTMSVGILQPASASSEGNLGPIVGEVMTEPPFGVGDFGNLPGVSLQQKARAMRELSAWRGGIVAYSDGLSDDIAAKQYPIARLMAEGGLNNAHSGQVSALTGLLRLYPFNNGVLQIKVKPQFEV